MFKDKTLLLVEDNLDEQEYMKYLLEDEFKQLFFAKNGEEGILQYQKNKPDIMITDLVMPIMNGLIMSQEIKKFDFYQPIILLTGYGDLEDLRKAINIGINAFVSKPIEDNKKILNAIRTVFNNVKKVNGFISNLEKEDIKTTELINDILQDKNEYIDYPAYI